MLLISLVVAVSKGSADEGKKKIMNDETLAGETQHEITNKVTKEEILADKNTKKNHTQKEKEPGNTLTYKRQNEIDKNANEKMRENNITIK